MDNNFGQTQGNSTSQDNMQGMSSEYQNQGNYNNNYSTSNNGYNQEPMMDYSPMEVKDWVITLLISFIPCANFIMLIVWAVSKTGNINRKNYAKAQLIMMVIGIAFSLIMTILFGASLVGILSNGYY